MLGNGCCTNGAFAGNDGILFFILVFLLLFGCCNDTNTGCNCN